jgi:hypothetical protein
MKQQKTKYDTVLIGGVKQVSLSDIILNKRDVTLSFLMLVSA